MRAIIAVARTTVLESLRERVLYGLAVFGLAMILLSLVVSNLALGHRIRVVTDLSLTGLLASGVLLAVILGANAISRDIERRVTLSCLPKPLARTEYFLGRFAGVLAIVAVNYILMASFATVVVAIGSPESGFPYGWGTYAATTGLIFLRIAIVAAISVTFSAMVSGTVAQIGALGIALAGHLTGQLKFFLEREPDPLSQLLAEVLYRLVPDLGALDSLYELIHQQPIATGLLGGSASYALCYAAAVLTLGCWVFSLREIA